MKKLLLYASFLLTLTTCTKRDPDSYLHKPIAGFFIKNNNCKGPCSVSFGNTTTGSDELTFSWDFGDGDTSKLENPTHIYKSGGIYPVQLVAQNKLGISVVVNKVIIQSDLPVGFFDLCRVDKITYVKVPITKPDGKPWDDLPGNSAMPELQWLVRDTNRIYIRGQELSQLVDFDQKSLPFVSPREGLSGSLRQFEQFYTLIVQDADEGGGEIIGSFKFRPIDYFPKQPDNATAPSSFQTNFTLSNSDGLEIIVTLSWQ